MALIKQKPKKWLGASNKSSIEGFLEAYSVTDAGETVFVSMPMVDKLSIHGLVPSSVYAQMGDQKVSGQAKLLSKLSLLLKSEESGAKPMHGGEYGYAKGSAKSGEVRLLLPLGARPAWGFISLRPPSKGSDTLLLRIDWNPRKAGKEGVRQIFELLIGDLAFQKEEVAEWLATARVSRMDVAVDILDVERCDLRAQIDAQRKIQTFGAPKNGLETSYHKDAKTKQFPVVLYDKRQHYLDAELTSGIAKTPKYGDRPHCRVERVWRFGGASARPLSKLGTEPNRIEGFHVRWLRDHQSGPSRREQRIAAAVIAHMGKDRALGVLGPQALASIKLVQRVDPIFWRPTDLWAYWPQSLEAVGLDLLITPHPMYQLP